MSDNAPESLADRVARTFPQAPPASRDAIVKALTSAWWDNMHVAFEDGNSQWRQALSLASEGLDLGVKAPPDAAEVARTLEAEAIAHVEKTDGRRFADIPAATRLAMLALAKQIILERRGDGPSRADIVRGEIENRAAVRAEYDARMIEHSVRTGDPLPPRQSIERIRALEDSADHLRLANTAPPLPKASPLQKNLLTLSKLRAAEKSAEVRASGALQDLNRRQQNSILMSIRSLSAATYEKVRAS